MSNQENYQEIDRPYDSLLQRTVQTETETSKPTALGENSSEQQALSSTSSANGNVETQPVKSDGSQGDVWIKNWIKSVNYKPKTTGFYIDGGTGYAEFGNVYVRGNIEALTGAIGGFVIGADYVRDVANSFGLASTVTAGDDVRFWAGDTFENRAIAPFRVFESGAIGSGNFVSGPLGLGWNIDNDGVAEFQNITIRGVIRTSVFEKDTLSAVNGLVMVSKADVLESSMTALDSSTVHISGETTFADDEVIRIKDGTDDEWMIVTDASAAPIYTVTRDLAGVYAANSNPVWAKGTAVVSMGVGTGAKTGFILLDSSSANSPYIDVYGRNSNTYSDYTLHGRFGWLKGIVDSEVGLSGTDVWGLYTDNAYIKGVIVAESGRFTGSVYVGATSNVNIAGADSRILISDGTNDRVLIGKGVGLF